MTDDKALVARCQALTNKGVPCNQPTLPGYPYCYNHIKSTSIHKVHDRYSGAIPAELQDHYQHQRMDDKPKDLSEEITCLRALLSKFLTAQGGNIHDHDNIMTIMQLIEGLGRTVERQSKIVPERVVTVADVMTVISRIVQVIDTTIPREQIEIRNKIVGGIQKCATELLSTSSDFTFGNQ